MRITATVVLVIALAVGVAPAVGERGGNGNGNGNREPTGACSVAGNVVTGEGLPTWELLNFMVTDAEGTHGWVLGQTDTGTWPVTVPERNGTTTYEFASKTWGPNGSKYDVFASCSA